MYDHCVCTLWCVLYCLCVVHFVYVMFVGIVLCCCVVLYIHP